MRRVVVTGMGAITPIGNSVDELKQEKLELTKLPNSTQQIIL